MNDPKPEQIVKRVVHDKNQENDNRQVLLQLQSQIENLQAILRDKEALIDNLIGRTGDQENYIVGKEQLLQNLNNELFEQKRYSESQEQTIAQRDKSIEQLEHNFKQTLEILTSKQQSDQTVTDLLSGFEVLRKQIDKKDQIAKELANVAQENSKLRRKHSSEVTGLGAENYELKNRIVTLSNEVLARSNQADHLTDELLLSNNSIERLSVEIVENNQQINQLQNDAGTLNNEINGLKADINDSNQVVEELNAQIERQHEWGRGALDKIAQLEQKIELMEKSFWWRATALFRKSPRALAWLARQCLQLLLSPYRFATLLGWRYTPQLFHRIYHQPKVQNLLGNPANNSMLRQSTKGLSGSKQSNPMTTSVSTSPTRKNINAKHEWHVGDRIDGPAR